MHIDRANKVTVVCESAGAACPSSAFGLVFVPAAGTPARCSSFGASEAQDAGLFRFVGQVVDVLAVLPQGHALVVVPAGVTVAHAVRVADEERADLVLDTEVDEPFG